MIDNAYFPPEDISPHALNAMVLTANRIMQDFGRTFDMVLSTGDTSDNSSMIEWTGWRTSWTVRKEASALIPAGHRFATWERNSRTIHMTAPVIRIRTFRFLHRLENPFRSASDMVRPGWKS